MFGVGYVDIVQCTFFREKEILEEHVNDLASTRSKLKNRVTDLEQELKKYVNSNIFMFV